MIEKSQFPFIIRRESHYMFLTAISFAIAVLQVGPKLRTFALLSFAEQCCVLLSSVSRAEKR